MATAKKTVKKTTTKTKSKKKKKLSSLNGNVYIHSTSNNTIISVADERGNVISWASSGSIGYKGSKKSTPYAAGLAATAALKKATDLGLKSVKIIVNGIGQGKDTAIRSIIATGINVTELEDATPVPHNGCKPPKKPR